MKNFLVILFLGITVIIHAQEQQTESTAVYKKRVLENAEIDVLYSYYQQDGKNAAVTGGIGIEDLFDIAANINVAIPLNDDDILSIDATVSAYTSASSSNLDPFSSGASGNGDDDDDDDDDNSPSTTRVLGSPWTESSGASKSDIWVNGNLAYSHSSDDRNNIWNANLNFASEYDYISIGFGGGFTKLFNQKNTEINAKANIYLDTWIPKYPTELDSYLEANQDLTQGFFAAADIFDQNGVATDKTGLSTWKPKNTTLIEDKGRNTYSLSLGVSQILSKRAQISFFADIVQQKGWLSNPMQRVYFGDIANYYIGNPVSIPNYTSPTNTDVFQLADDIERLPDSRLKIPLGMRFNYYINETFVLRTYYRFYSDDWQVTSHTASVELPIKITDKFTLYPAYRYYSQTQASYFAPFEELISTNDFYTSDYDLSAFSSNQYTLGLSYTDIFTKFNIWKFNLKKIDLRYSYYQRNSGLKSGIVSLGFKTIFN